MEDIQDSSEELQKCSVGILLDDNCHKKSYSRTTGFILVTNLTEEEQKLLRLRAEINLLGCDQTICNHHKAVYITRYESRQTSCVDPFKRHKKLFKGTLPNFNLLSFMYE
jgi:hypothetical protein